MSTELSFQLPTHIHTFDNGLVLIIREDHSNPVATVQGWVCTGSIHESEWLGSGISHFLEHLLFKGTVTRKGSRIDHEVQEAGGYINAYTTFDRTVCWINIPSDNVKVAIDVLCDVLQNAVIPEEEFAKEADVIRREMDMGEDDPQIKSTRLLFETAYTKSHYRFPVIGYKHLFNQLTRADVLNYYRARYVPNNMFLVVVGDVQPEAIVEEVQRAIGQVSPKPLPSQYLPLEPPQLALRELSVEAPIELAHLHLAWHIPEISHPDMPALDILALVLGIGKSSRLYVELQQRNGLVSSVDAWTFNPGSEGLFGVSATLRAENLSSTLDRIHGELERVKTEGITEEELRKAVKQFISARLATRKTVQGQAADLGSSWIVAKDLNFQDSYLEKVKAVTPDRIREVANKYIISQNMTKCALVPFGANKTKQKTYAKVEQASPRLVKLSNGLRLVLKEDRKLPFVHIVAVFGGGVLVESSDTAGMTRLLSRMLLQGTATRSSENIASEIESIGGSINTFSGHHTLGISLEVMAEDFQKATDILFDVLFDSVFPEDAFERERGIQLAQIAEERDDLLTHGLNLMKQALFGQVLYGLNPLGTEESVKRLTLDLIKRTWNRLRVPTNCVIAIYGCIGEQQAISAFEPKIAGWLNEERFSLLGEVQRANVNHRGPSRVLERHRKNQTVVVVGLPGTTIYSADKYSVELIQESCSDMGSRLFMRIRDSLGLAYYTGAINFPGLVPGYLAFYAGTAPSHTDKVVEEILADLRELRENGLNESELARAKAKLLGQRKLARQDLGAQAMAAALDELYGLGFQNQLEEDRRYEAVSILEVRGAIDKYIDPEKAVVTILCPEDGAPPSA